MKTYIAIGYFKGDKSQTTTCFIQERRTKIEMIQICKENGFVAHLILTDAQILELDEMDEVELVKTILPLIHHTKRIWVIVSYLYYHLNSIKENI